ncbi:MAG: T9SS type A sorting domain-containing protein [Saprospiraceae bacterium]|nr:T9SS type A sorting domain-containing protein [Saprospiraceae bacterium]
MSRISLCIICFLCLTYQVRAQVVYERTFPYEAPSIQIPIELSDTTTFSLGSNSYCGGIGTRHIDQSGNELMGNLFGAEAFSSGYYWIGHDSVLIWAEEGAMDVGPDSFRVYIWTPDSINKILSISVREHLEDTRRYGAYMYTADRLVYEKSDTLYTKNLYTSIVEDSLIIPYLYHIIEFEKNILVFSDMQSPLVLDNELNIIYEWDNLASLPFNMGVVLDSFLVGRAGLNPTSIAIVNVYDEAQQVIDLSGYFDQIQDIQSNKNMLFVKGIFNGEPYVLKLNSEFSVVEISTLDMPELDKEMSFHYYPDRVYACGYDGLANYKANYRMSYKYIEASPIKYLDIALDSMWVDSVYFWPEEYHLPANVYILATIRNHSSETIHAYTVHWEETPVFWCDPGVYPWPMEGRNIEPGAVDTVSFQSWSYAVAHGATYVKRFFVQHANHHLDDDITNNSFELIHIFSSTDNPSSSPISIFPNPFIDVLSTSSTSVSVKMVLYDQMGRVVSIGQDQLNDLGSLPPGIYFLNVQTSGSIATMRVIKME